MSLPTTTITKSVKLQAGEQFILPPGAKLVSSSNSAALSSTCDLGDLEDLSCYAFVFGNGAEDGDDGQLFEASGATGSVTFTGLNYNGKFFASKTEIRPADGSGIYPQTLLDAVNSTSLGQIIYEGKLISDNNSDFGVMAYLVFKGTSSIASKLSMTFKTWQSDFNQNNTAVQNIIFNVPARPYAEVANYNSIPECI